MNKGVPRIVVVFVTILFVALIGGAFVAYGQTGTGTGGGNGKVCRSGGLLTAEEAAKFPPSPSGNACAIFHICEGDQVVEFVDVPNCSQNLTVWCMDSNGQWVNATVHDVSVSPDGTALLYLSDQRGHCGLFPAGANLNSSVIK